MSDLLDLIPGGSSGKVPVWAWAVGAGAVLAVGVALTRGSGGAAAAGGVSASSSAIGNLGIIAAQAEQRFNDRADQLAAEAAEQSARAQETAGTALSESQRGTSEYRRGIDELRENLSGQLAGFETRQTGTESEFQARTAAIQQQLGLTGGQLAQLRSMFGEQMGQQQARDAAQQAALDRSRNELDDQKQINSRLTGQLQGLTDIVQKLRVALGL